MNFLILGLGCVAYLIIRSIAKNATIEVPVVYAGSPMTGYANSRVIPAPKNKPIYREGEKEIDVSRLKQFVVIGCSLEPLGIRDEDVLYVEIIDQEHPVEQKSLIGRYVIYKIDTERTRLEHPLKPIDVTEGFKARKVLAVVKTKQKTEVIKEEVKKFIKEDEDDLMESNIEDCIQRVLNKYLFASEYYKDDDYLLMSITYKNGKKDLSFHSVKFLYGVVKYASK